MTTKITTHLDDAIARLAYQFKEIATVKALINMQSVQVQQLEDSIFDFLTKLPLQTAEGAVLDRWGDVLGEARLGDSDADYRSRLFFTITRNISNGTPEELISFCAFLLQTTGVQLNELFPGVVNLSATNVTNMADPVLIKAQLQQLCPAGVRIGWLIIGEFEHPFAFAGHPNPNARGFDTYPVEEIGGVLTSAY